MDMVSYATHMLNLQLVLKEHNDIVERQLQRLPAHVLPFVTVVREWNRAGTHFGTRIEIADEGYSRA